MTTQRMTLAAFALAALSGLPACQQYSTYPEIATSRGIPENPNNPAAAACMIASIQYVASRYAPGGPNYAAATAAEQASLSVNTPVVLNLPRGLRRSLYQHITTQVGPKAMPMSDDALVSGAPVLHVTRVWLRFNHATVDVLRPMPELGPGTDGRPIYQLVTVRLDGGFEPWHVIHARAFEPNSAEVPEPYFLPAEDRVDQYDYQLAKDREYKPGLGLAQ